MLDPSYLILLALCAQDSRVVFPMSFAWSSCNVNISVLLIMNYANIFSSRLYQFRLTVQYVQSLLHPQLDNLPMKRYITYIFLFLFAQFSPSLVDHPWSQWIHWCTQVKSCALIVYLACSIDFIILLFILCISSSKKYYSLNNCEYNQMQALHYLKELT